MLLLICCLVAASYWHSSDFMADTYSGVEVHFKTLKWILCRTLINFVSCNIKLIVVYISELVMVLKAQFCRCCMSFNSVKLHMKRMVLQKSICGAIRLLYNINLVKLSNFLLFLLKNYLCFNRTARITREMLNERIFFLD